MVGLTRGDAKKHVFSVFGKLAPAKRVDSCVESWWLANLGLVDPCCTWGLVNSGGASRVAGSDSVLTAVPMLTERLLFFSIIDLIQTLLQ